MTEQETQPATCGECRVVVRNVKGGPEPEMDFEVAPCSLHAQAKALLEALEAVMMGFGEKWSGAPIGITIFRDSPLAAQCRIAIAAAKGEAG